MAESTCAFHTLCPSTAIVIISITKMIVGAFNFICALPGHRFRFALTVAVAAILRNLLIVTAEDAPVLLSQFVTVAEPATEAEPGHCRPGSCAHPARPAASPHRDRDRRSRGGHKHQHRP